MADDDARRLGITEGDLDEVESRRGRIEARAKLGDIAPGQVFIPFHYGYSDDPERSRAANELTIYEWDPVSKQPHYKYAAVRLRKVERSRTDQPEEGANKGRGIALRIKQAATAVMETVRPPRPHIADYLALLDGSERALTDALEAVAEHHAKEHDIYNECRMLASWSRAQLQDLGRIIARYGEAREAERDRLRDAVWPKLKQSGFSLVRDLHDCWLLANETHMSLLVLDQPSKALRDKELEALLEQIDHQNKRQRSWLETRIKQAAPQALTVPS